MTDIQNNQKALEFGSDLDKLIRAVIDASFEYENIPPRGVSVVITDNEEIRKLNNEYRGKDVPTDVLSFPLFDIDGTLDPEEMGDIVISLERAYSQAEEYGHSVRREVGFLTAHSMLHLMGYDHEEDEKEMFEKQEEILKMLGIER